MHISMQLFALTHMLHDSSHHEQSKDHTKMRSQVLPLSFYWPARLVCCFNASVLSVKVGLDQLIYTIIISWLDLTFHQASSVKSSTVLSGVFVWPPNSRVCGMCHLTTEYFLVENKVTLPTGQLQGRVPLYVQCHSNTVQWRPTCACSGLHVYLTLINCSNPVIVGFFLDNTSASVFVGCLWHAR